MKLNLLKELALTDFKLRYKNSVLGYLWSLLKPLAIFGTLYFVYSIFIRFNEPYYPLFLLLGILLWTYFNEATINGMYSFVSKATLITKMKIERRVIPLASNITSLLTLILNLVIFFVFLAIIKPHFSLTFFYLPLTIVELFIISLGVSYGLAALFVKLRDLANIWDIVLQMGFWITPIVYPISLVPAKYLPFIHANPMYRIIEEARLTLIYGQWPTWKGVFLTLLSSAFVFTVGYLIFSRRASSIAEDL